MDNKALFIINTSECEATSLPGVIRKIDQARSAGVVTVSVWLTPTNPELSSVDISHVVLDVNKWSFPRFAWWLARRLNLDLHRSSTIISEEEHLIWARQSGVQNIMKAQSL